MECPTNHRGCCGGQDYLGIGRGAGFPKVPRALQEGPGGASQQWGLDRWDAPGGQSVGQGTFRGWRPWASRAHLLGPRCPHLQVGILEPTRRPPSPVGKCPGDPAG